MNIVFSFLVFVDIIVKTCLDNFHRFQEAFRKTDVETLEKRSGISIVPRNASNFDMKVWRQFLVDFLSDVPFGKQPRDIS